MADGSARGFATPRFSIDTIGGALLVLATVAALVAANSSAATHYADFLEHEVGLHIAGAWHGLTVHAIVSDGLMTAFFFAVGLEIRRELHSGTLADTRRAALPAAAALGGIIAPAAIYFALNEGGPAARGWGVPTATDIAFAVAALSLLGKRSPPTLRVLLLALAVLDDVGGILLISFFYSGDLESKWIGVMIIGIVMTFAMRANAFRRPWAYLVPGTIVWVGMHEAGIHPTMAGVLMGVLAPPMADVSRGETSSPSERLQKLLHPWVALLVMPLFAFASAGVRLELSPADPRVAVGVALALVIGKPIGIVAASVLAIRLRIATIPAELGWSGLCVLGTFAGIGFTVALFIAELALPDPALLASAKLGILAGSAISLALALVLGRLVFARPLLHRSG
jgi:NhaA family Na+:H+ antiporter